MPVAHINVLQGHSKDVLKRVIRDVSNGHGRGARGTQRSVGDLGYRD